MVNPQKSSKEKEYNRKKIIVSIMEMVVGLLFLLLVVLTGFSTILENWIRSYLNNSYLVLVAFTAIIGLMDMIIMFPLSWYSGYHLEHKFELSNQSFGQWLWEKTKGMFVSIPIGVILLLIFYYLLRNYETYWWVIMGTVMLLFSVILARLAPVLIFPLFYDFEKLENEELAQKVKTMCEKVGMDLKGVFQFNLSKNTKKGNAAFTGLGKSRRVILGDTMLEKLEEEEILSVLAHELGHYKLKHLWKGMTFSIVTTYTGLFLVSLLYNQFYPLIGEYQYTIAALPLMAIILSLYSFITSPISNAYSRKNEREADDFAVELTGNKQAFISGLEKLSKQNLSDPDPHPVAVFFYYSHPPIKKRLARLENK
ncbi:MAG: M48 family metallopeptidase [Candidatus Marinimicrobia bacterium]|nr:M48 family metallopeptidase [Candidatus Neomarinimicrobiota bacterium]